MNSRLRCLPYVAAVALAALMLRTACSDPAPATGKNADWPMLGGTPSRNLVNSIEKNVPETWSLKKGQRKNIKWVAELSHDQTYGNPVIAGGKIFVGTNNDNTRDPKIKGDQGILLCLNAADGSLIWQAAHEKLDNPQENDWPKAGIASTPCVEGNRVYYVSNRCELVCADTENGKPEWKLDMVKDLGVFPRFLAMSSPVIGGEFVFVITGNGVDGEHKLPAPDATSFVAVNKQTGKVKWKDSSPGKNIMDGQWGSPAYVEINGKGQAIFPGGDGWLYAFEGATGKLVWKFDCNPKTSMFRPGGRGERNYFLSVPVVADNRLYIGTGRDPDNEGGGTGHFWCVDLLKATEKGAANKDHDVSARNDNFDPKAEVNKDSALGWHVGGELEPKPKDDPREYAFGRTVSSAAVADGLVYIPELTGYFYCFDAKTGEKVWDFDMKAATWASPYVVDGKVYLGTDDSNVFIFKQGRAAPKAPVPAIDVDKQVKGPVTVVGGVLYVRTSTQLIAIASK